MTVAATVEASAGLISRQRLRQAATGPGRERSVQALLDPRRSLISALQLVQAITIAQVNESQVTKVASFSNPAHEGDLLANVSCPQGST